MTIEEKKKFILAKLCEIHPNEWELRYNNSGIVVAAKKHRCNIVTIPPDGNQILFVDEADEYTSIEFPLELVTNLFNKISSWWTEDRISQEVDKIYQIFAE